MPLMKLECSTEISDENKNSFNKQASKLVSELLGKSENYVMCIVEDRRSMSFAGSDAPCAYVEFKSIGLPEQDTGKLASAICELVSSALSIHSDRIYIEFANAQRHMWGWNNRTF